MRRLLIAALFASASPAIAQQDPLAPIVMAPILIVTPAPAPILAPPRIIPTNWRQTFDAIRAEDWAGAIAGIETLPDSPLRPVARAELYTARNSPRVELAPLLALLAEAPDLPQADQLQKMAIARGAVDLPPSTPTRGLVSLSEAPRRVRARPISGEPAADALRDQLVPFVDADDGPGAEALLLTTLPLLSIEARAEASQRVAWIYYVLGRDADTRRVADQGRLGAVSEWGAQAAWVGALAAWRMGDCTASKAGFGDAMRLGTNAEFTAAAAYWGARSAQACRRPREVEPLLIIAARSSESFYGLLARDTLGLGTTLPRPDPSPPAARVAGYNNVRRATALAAIGERALAEQMLRYQARIGSPSDQEELIAVARGLDLGGAQYWLAHNGQPGTRVAAADRYPAPRWVPDHGWRIDPALAFAHVIQESSFRADAVSPANAIGLMQVRPGAASDTARARGDAFTPSLLKRPETNLDHGQAFIELIRGSSATKGQLPRVIAAYNAGPVPVERWKYINDRGDPLLWIESIPYWETRYYVPAVMRNMWVYQGLAGAPQPTLRSLVQHQWPAFPAPTANSVR